MPSQFNCPDCGAVCVATQLLSPGCVFCICRRCEQSFKPDQVWVDAPPDNRAFTPKYIHQPATCRQAK